MFILTLLTSIPKMQMFT